MDSLLEKVDALIQAKTITFDEQFAKTEAVSEEAMGKVAVGLLVLYLLHPTVFKIISMLTLERMSDAKAYEAYQRIVFTLPLQQQTRAFQQMIERGFIKDNDPALLAEQYYSIVYFAFQKNCIGVELNDEIISYTALEIDQNIKDFFRRIKTT